MTAKKKGKAASSEAPADEVKASGAEEGPEPFVALKNVYRADLGESLPPQKPAGVE